jgi:hypothetical protein
MPQRGRAGGARPRRAVGADAKSSSGRRSSPRPTASSGDCKGALVGAGR